MKTKDVAALDQVLWCLQNNMPVDSELLDDFRCAVINCRAALEKQKRHYQDHAQYYREKTREWAQNNPEKVRKYQKDYDRQRRKKR